ncbi:RICIN domain-containing protein [Streptomyces sp. NPDC005963]|uniref:RICIN domain-containing protein n=1 Tax=Streptomyces sp. NPDC005963 TaxID=3156721 RepID=UPI0033FC12C1
MSSEQSQISVELRLPFITIGTSNVRSVLQRRNRRIAGPFMIVSVTSGLALDTAFTTAQGSLPHLWPTHGKPHQLWHLKPSGHRDEVHIVSAANRLLLDGAHLAGEGDHPRMSASNGEARQRWRLASAPDGRAHQLVCVGTGKALDCPWEAERTTRPVLWEPHDGENQHWVLAMPFSAAE